MSTAPLTPPSDPAAERALLAGFLVCPAEAMAAVEGAGLTGADFYSTRSRELFAVLTALASDGGVDVARTLAELTRRGLPADAAELADLGAGFSTVSTLPAHAARLRELSGKRNLLAATVRAARALQEPGAGLATVRESLAAELAAESGPKASSGFASIAQELEHPGALDRPERIPTGLAGLDTALGGGLVRGGLTILAGRTSTGKSSLLRVLAANLAPYGMAFLTLEDDSAECRRKLCGIFGGGDMAEGERRFREERPPLWLDHETTDLDKLLCALNGHTQRGEIIAAAVDQLSWLRLEGEGETYREVSHCVQELKLLAKRRRLAVVLAVQINRAGATAESNGSRIGLHHLRDSGRIEESADAVLVIQSLDGETGRMEIDLLKNRQGRRDLTVALRLDFLTGLVYGEGEASLPQVIDRGPGRKKTCADAPKELSDADFAALLDMEPKSINDLTETLQEASGYSRRDARRLVDSMVKRHALAALEPGHCKVCGPFQAVFLGDRRGFKFSKVLP